MKKMIAVIVIAICLMLPLAAAHEDEEEEETAVHILFASITVVFGAIALLWTYSAKKKLAAGTSLRQYINNFLVALALIVAATIWHLIREVTDVAATMGEAAEYPEYFLYIMAFLVFVLAAYQMKFISEEFSFEEQAKVMKKALAGPKRKKR